MLTVDRAMQYETEQILSQQVASAKAKGGIAIVSNPSTGEILAMANVDADPKTGRVTPSSNNAALTTVYEPGSVMKIATISKALERGLITPDHQDRRARHLLGRRHVLLGRRGACHRGDDRRPDRGPVDQHRDHQDRAGARQQRRLRRHPRPRLRQPDRAALPQRGGRDRAVPVAVVGDLDRHAAHRAGDLGHRAAGARGLQHHRQRRPLRRPAAGRRDHRLRKVTRTRCPPIRATG